MINNLKQAISISNIYAPEHLILQIDNAASLVNNIYSASAVFVGHFAPETVGDYVTGANHVLPTHGYAKSYSGLSITDFTKFISVQYVSEIGLKNIGKQGAILAQTEGLEAHKQAVSIRLENLKECS